MKQLTFGLAWAFVAALTIAAPAIAGGVDELPQDIQETLYNKDMLDPMQPIGESAYRDWKPKKGPPWKIGYASSYAGNTWRANVMDRLQNIADSQVEEARADQRRHHHTVQSERFRPDPADAPAGRPGRRCDHRLLLESDRPQSRRSSTPMTAACRYSRSSGYLDLALFRQFFGQFRGRRQHAGRMDGQRDRRQGQRPHRRGHSGNLGFGLPRQGRQGRSRELSRHQGRGLRSPACGPIRWRRRRSRNGSPPTRAS